MVATILGSLYENWPRRPWMGRQLWAWSKVAEEIGFETRAIKADMTLFDLPDLTFPFVAHVLKEGKLLHYYVVTGQDKDSIHIADPDPGVKLTKTAT